MMAADFGGSHFTDWYECPECRRQEHEDWWNTTVTVSADYQTTKRECPECGAEALVILSPEGVLLVNTGETL